MLDTDTCFDRARHSRIRALLLCIIAALTPLLLSLSPVNAQGNRERMRWGGAVDDTVEVMVRRGDVKVHAVKGRGVEEEKKYFYSKMPERSVHVRLARVRGRGKVTIFQQPARGNNYTAGILVKDAQNGRSNYEFVLSWE